MVDWLLASEGGNVHGRNQRRLRSYRYPEICLIDGFVVFQSDYVL